MAAEETNLDFDWRNPASPLIADLPWTLENYSKVKCYRNVILIWLFHTPLLLNWIDDNHEQHGAICPLCTLRELARRFWSTNRHLDLDETFDRDVDEFWKATHLPGLIEHLDRENDAEEYMKSLLGFIKGCGFDGWTELIQVRKQCAKRCKECSYHTQDSEEDFEEDFFLQGTISHKDIEYKPLCHTLHFNKSEKAACRNEGCPSKKRESKPDEDHRPEHDFFYGLRGAPPILVIHCKPYTYTSILSDGRFESYLSGKVTRLEHLLALSSYPDRSLDPNTINWAFYHLYGVIFRRGDTGSTGHYVCAFEQRQTGRWLFFNDAEEGLDDEGRPITEEVTTPLTRSQLDEQVDEMQKDDGRIFMLMYRRIFQVPIRRLTRITFPSTVIALQDRQYEEAGEPGTENAPEEYFTPGECVGDENLLGSESSSGQTRGETQGAAGDELQEGPSDLETRIVQAEQPVPTEQPAEQNAAVEADPDSSIPKPATGQTRGETPGAAANASQRDASGPDSELRNRQAEQPLPADLLTEQGVEVEADPESSTARPDTTKTGGRAQAEKSTQNESQVEDENEQMTSSQPTSEIVRTEVEPSVQPRKEPAKGKATKRTHDNAMDGNEETSTSVPASKKARTGAKSSTQPKKKETKSKATKRTRKDASDDREHEKPEMSAPSTKGAKAVVDSSTGYGGRETRSRARAKRKNEEIPDVDKIETEQTATSKPATKKAKPTQASAQTGKAQTKSKAQRKK